MGVYVIKLKKGVSIYVIAINESDAAYKAYRKAMDRIEGNMSNEGYVEWRNKIKKISMIYKIKIDKEQFNLY